ncbi:MAG: hypothetical protein ND895_06040, partial [Pyrinomonadaceae bacterium]|nr:hypothetical protein [Pyrinomonadaceae bacterium]
MDPKFNQARSYSTLGRVLLSAGLVEFRIHWLRANGSVVERYLSWLSLGSIGYGQMVLSGQRLLSARHPRQILM